MASSTIIADGTGLALSICIATFNRAAFIADTLNSILCQCSSEVELVVLDGGSTDDTERIMKSYLQRSERLRYIRQDTNAGVDRDFNSVVEHARGRYCWLMSDDDLLTPGAVGTVVAALRSEPSLIIVNAEVRSADMQQVLRRRQLSFTGDRSYAPGEMDRLFVETGDYLTFIACVVIKREIWLERQKEPYFGSLFIHVGVIFQERLPAEVRVLAQPLIQIRYGNAMWRPKEFEIWMFKWPSLIWSLAGLSERAKKEGCVREPWRKLSRLFLYRAKGTYSKNEYRHWIRPQLRSAIQRFPALLIAVLPGVLANAAMMCYYRLRADHGMGILDMRNSRFHARHWLFRPGGS